MKCISIILAAVILLSVSCATLTDIFSCEKCRIPNSCHFDNDCVAITNPNDPIPNEILVALPLGKDSLVFDKITTPIANLIWGLSDSVGTPKVDSLKASGLTDSVISIIIKASIVNISDCLCNGRLFRVQSDFLFGIETRLADHANTTQVPEMPDAVWSANYIFDNSQFLPNKRNLIKEEYDITYEDINDTTTYASILVAIIDDGAIESRFHSNNRHLNSSISSIAGSFGINVLDWSPNVDNHGHGAKVSETILFSANQYLQTLSEWNALKILPIKAMDDCGQGNAYDIACAMYCAKNENADIINMSLGNYQRSLVIELAVTEVTDQSRIIVSSAGNRELNLENDENKHFPSIYTTNQYVTNHVSDYVLEVGSTCERYDQWSSTMNQLLDISNYRDSMFVTGGIYNIDILKNCSDRGTSISAGKLSAKAASLMINGVGATDLKNALYSSTSTSTINSSGRTYFKVN